MRGGEGSSRNSVAAFALEPAIAASSDLEVEVNLASTSITGGLIQGEHYIPSLIQFRASYRKMGRFG